MFSPEVLRDGDGYCEEGREVFGELRREPWGDEEAGPTAIKHAICFPGMVSERPLMVQLADHAEIGVRP